MNKIETPSSSPHGVRKTSRRTDVVGIAYRTDLVGAGLPAIRLAFNKAGIPEITAIGEAPSEGLTLPTDWAQMRTTKDWVITGPLVAPYVALAVEDPVATLSLKGNATADELGVEPQSKEGVRVAHYGMSEPTIALMATIPEYVALWPGKLFPEGRHPALTSLQVAQSAAINVSTLDPHFELADGSLIALYVFESMTAIVGYQAGELTLYREYPVGRNAMRAALKTQMQVPEELIPEILVGEEIDLSSIFSPILKPLYRQVEISANFLSSRTGVPVSTFVIYGIDQGVHHWQKVFLNEHFHPLTEGTVLGGFAMSPAVTEQVSQWPEHWQHRYLIAAGAAWAAMGE